jgi:hypothetical protein
MPEDGHSPGLGMSGPDQSGDRVGSGHIRRCSTRRVNVWAGMINHSLPKAEPGGINDCQASLQQNVGKDEAGHKKGSLAMGSRSIEPMEHAQEAFRRRGGTAVAER